MIGVRPMQFTMFTDAFASSSALTSSNLPDFTARVREEYVDLSVSDSGDLPHAASNWDVPDMMVLK
jgi:hypothetical protein